MALNLLLDLATIRLIAARGRLGWHLGMLFLDCLLSLFVCTPRLSTATPRPRIWISGTSCHCLRLSPISNTLHNSYCHQHLLDIARWDGSQNKNCPSARHIGLAFVSDKLAGLAVLACARQTINMTLATTLSHSQSSEGRTFLVSRISEVAQSTP